MPPETKEQPGAAVDEHDDEREEKSPAAGEVARPKPDYSGPSTPRPAGHGFFAIYKKGQGYWTRMGTALGALLLGGLTAYNLYVYLPVLIHFDTTQAGQTRAREIALGVAAAFLVGFAVLS